MIPALRQTFVYLVLTTFTFFGFTQSVQAAMIGTEQVHAATASSEHHDRILSALNRPEVMSQLEQMGVNRADAQARVAALTDEEAASLAAQIDSLPAGGDIIGALLFVFVLLLVTDILGLTKVFPFTRSARR